MVIANNNENWFILRCSFPESLLSRKLYPVKRKKPLVFVVVLCAAMLFSGCSRAMLVPNTLENPSGPTSSRFKNALRETLYDPSLWLGAVSAAAIVASGEERSISRWAYETNPVFGSVQRAENFSYYLRNASMGSTALIYLLRNLPREEWSIEDPLINAGAIATSTALTTGTAFSLKHTTRRLRPDSSDSHSFLSGHTSIASVCNTLSSKMIAGMSFPKTHRVFYLSGLSFMTAATAWARLEAGKHFPTDLIAGAILGTFVGNVVYGTLMGPYQPEKSRIDIHFTPEMIEMRFAVGF